MTALLVGLHPPKKPGPRPFDDYRGLQLARLAGLQTAAELLEVLEATYLVKTVYAVDIYQCRLAALRIADRHSGRLILSGHAVAAAFGVDFRPWSVWRLEEIAPGHSREVAVIPSIRSFPAAPHHLSDVGEILRSVIPQDAISVSRGHAVSRRHATIGDRGRRFWLTYDEVAEMLDCSTRQVQRYIKSGRLKANKMSHKITRFRLEDVEAFIDRGLGQG